MERMTNERLNQRIEFVKKAFDLGFSIRLEAAEFLSVLEEVREYRNANQWHPISQTPGDCKVVYCWSEKNEVGVEARYRNGEWIACHDDEEDEEENFTHWIELPKGPTL
ncbi:hypothetical protein EHE65_19250 [Salmonella enterica subsp. enterica]|nr:hypothetical protein [Salmonella enterica subsp. enterica]